MMPLQRRLEEIPKEHAYPIKFGALEELLLTTEAKNIHRVCFIMTKMDDWCPLIRIHRWGNNRPEHAGEIVVTVYSVESRKKQFIRDAIVDKIFPKIGPWIHVTNAYASLVDQGVIYGIDDSGEIIIDRYGGNKV